MSSLTEPLVTVIIDTYNYGRFIERAIDSVLHQSFPLEQIEIVVVDDGSTDDTPKRVAGYGSQARYIWKPNAGQASALNVGLREARGAVVCLLDADDYFYQDKISRVIEAMQQHPDAGLIYNEFDIVDGSGHTLPKAYPNLTWTGRRIRAASVADQLPSLILLGHPWTCPTSTISLRRSLVGDLSIPEDVFPQSPDVFLGLVLPFIAGVAVVDTPLTGYVYHGDNVGLFRSSARNREIQERQEEFVLRHIEERFGRQFISYRGRSVYGRQEWTELDALTRVNTFTREAKQVLEAHVDSTVKRHCLAKLVATLLLPAPAYDALRATRTRLTSLQRRHYEATVRTLMDTASSRP